jgi:TfoX/Sxy family transcriptional regulator of competence genes
MATKQSTVDYVADQMSGAGDVQSRKMFGEYALYCDGKVVALVCDNRLYIKPTDAGKAFIGSVTEASPYPGAKMYYLIEEEKWEDREWLCSLVVQTAAALPLPKKKKK